MNAIEITNLKKIYSSNLKALAGINITVKQGDFFGLLGPNGAGKTTAIGIITSLVNKTEGEVKIFGHSLATELELAKSCLGLVPQEFNFNVFEKVLSIVVTQGGYYGLPRELALQRAEKYLKQLGLWEKRNRPARELSGGMKRRLMIARAMVHEPKLLILDEPTAGVDIELRRSMWQFLQSINDAGTTIILTTHYLEEAEYLCKNIAIIDGGEIIEHASKKELLSKLNTETIVLDLANAAKNSDLPSVKEFKLTLTDETTLEATFSKTENLNNLFTSLSNKNITVLSMRNKTNRLEELFLSLTKQSL